MNQSTFRNDVVVSGGMKMTVVFATILFTLAAIGAVVNYTLSHRAYQTSEAGVPPQQ